MQKEQDRLTTNYINKKKFGYFFKKMMNDENIDMKFSKTRAVNKTVSSHFEGYLNAIHDQEIPTKFLINKANSIQDKNQHVTKNANCVKTTLKMLTISSAHAQKYPFDSTFL